MNWGCTPPEIVPSDEVHGTITVHGYPVDPSDIQVRARPIPSENKAADAARPVVVSATRVAGGGPSQFEFRLSGLEQDVPYRIGVKVINQEVARYPRLAWSTDRNPMVLAGAPSLSFDAYAVRSEIEVMTLDESGDRAEWVGADGLEFTDPAQGVRTFRWRTSLPNVTGGQLQISLVPFPRIAERVYDPCANGDEGIVYRQDFETNAVAGEWVILPSVNFHGLLLRGPVDSPDGGAIREAAIAAAAANPDWETVVLPKLEAGHPLYVRVIPNIAGETICDPERGGVPPEVVLARIVLKILDSQPAEEAKIALGQVWYTKPDYGARPNNWETCYRVTKNHKVVSPFSPGFSVWDMMVAQHMSGVTYGGTAVRNSSFCVPPASDDDDWLESFTDSFGAVLTGIVDALGEVANYTSKLWEEIQDAVVDVAASAIDEVGIINCGQGSTCRAALETGLEIGLATMGVPPSLPNFDELVDQGVDYVAAQVASQVGVPQVVADYASQEAQDLVKKVVNDMKTSYGMPGLPDWLVPDIRFKPAYLTMEVYGPGKSQPFNSRPSLIRNNSPIYAGAMVPLPVLLPKQGVDPPILFPMVLPPNTAGLPEAPPIYSGAYITLYPSEYVVSVWNKKHWIDERYLNGCYSLHLTALSDPGGVYKVFSAKFKTEDPSAACP